MHDVSRLKRSLGVDHEVLIFVIFALIRTSKYVNTTKRMSQDGLESDQN